MKNIALMAAASMAALSVVSRPIDRDQPLDELFGSGMDLFPHDFPNLMVERDSPEETARYTEYLRAKAEAQQPRIDAAAAKRERKRLKLARSVG